MIALLLLVYSRCVINARAVFWTHSSKPSQPKHEFDKDIFIKWLYKFFFGRAKMYLVYFVILNLSYFQEMCEPTPKKNKMDLNITIPILQGKENNINIQINIVPHQLEGRCLKNQEDEIEDNAAIGQEIRQILDTNKAIKQEETAAANTTNEDLLSDISSEPFPSSDEESSFENCAVETVTKEPALEYNYDGAIGELITAADISIANLVYDEDQMTKGMKTSHNGPTEIEDVTQVLRWRSERAVLLSCSHSLGIYPKIEENGIYTCLEDLVKKFSHKNILVDNEITNMALIISTLFYLIHESSQFAVKSITIAATSLASKLHGSELDWNLILTKEQFTNLSSHELAIQNLLRNHMTCIVDPVKHVDKLWQSDTKVTKSIRKIAKLHAQKCLQDRFLVQTQIPTDIAKISLRRAIVDAL